MTVVHATTRPTDDNRPNDNDVSLQSLCDPNVSDTVNDDAVASGIDGDFVDCDDDVSYELTRNDDNPGSPRTAQR